MSKLTNDMYKASRALSKLASTLKDIETLIEGDPEKIIKRGKKKIIGKTLFKLSNKIMKKL